MKILLIRLRLIGDVVFTTPAIRALRHAFAGAHISYLVEPQAAVVVTGQPHLDEVIVAERRRGVARLADDARLAMRLRRARYDLVVDFHGGPRASWLTLATAAPRRIGYDIPGRRWMYTDVVPRARELRPRHSVENQWDLLAALSPELARPPDPATHPVEMAEDPAAAHAVEGRFAASGLGRGHEVIVLHVSAGNPFRRWPVEAFVQVITALSAAAANRRIILSSGPSENEAASRIGAEAAARLPAARRDAVVPFGEMDIAELRAVISRAALFIGGDTGPLHVAATTATPIVGIYGPTLPERSAPWRDPSLATESVDIGALPCRPCDQRRCLPGDFRCLTALPAARVVEAAERALSRERTRNRTGRM